ncbi:pyrroline-5-carboxylate reductase [Rhodoplanes sp. TEM]|uniref:Pyrroline-5-carboxylate reductase n=1 Tax=Rhodoplanes tepidamans TaxID=200616 RepID=A0ABT5JAC1_RHOTP|nr:MULTISPECIES: pyrroline-5-carboxylate reductase [Rhodoplanes]MDC7786587.1 pyrroline-5-carboxylate reductase [Rhodoplanes tepidamans]MDC7983075.1 pyrroline-5-carboxylate reductase [Rhodoplanes sp. TEM]MDQ0357532.1 pyrroline-5-carboxylate reductase [Rhodoplanes tepidamans]
MPQPKSDPKPKTRAAAAGAGPLAGLKGPIVLVGAGKMGGALLDGWLRLGLDPRKIVVLEPHPSADVAAQAIAGLRLNPDPAGLKPEAVVLAVKPQTAPEALPPLAPLAGHGGVMISIMAGRTLGFLTQVFGPGTAAVRAMPNTPAAIGRGMTVAVANAAVTAAGRTLAQNLLGATGKVDWVAEEDLIDAVTAVSGSGPAYVFLLAESLARAGVAAGLPPDLARKIARETVAGAGELLYRSPLDAATLRKNVTSPGGTTAAALDVLMAADGLDPLLEKAIAAATKRSRELAG